MKLFYSFLNNYSSSVSNILQNALSITCTVITFKPYKFNVNLWTLCFVSYKKYRNPLTNLGFAVRFAVPLGRSAKCTSIGPPRKENYRLCVCLALRNNTLETHWRTLVCLKIKHHDRHSKSWTTKWSQHSHYSHILVLQLI